MTRDAHRERVEGAEPVVDEAGLRQLAAADRAAGLGLRLEHEHPPTGVGQAVGGHQPVGARTDDDRVDIADARGVHGPLVPTGRHRSSRPACFGRRPVREAPGERRRRPRAMFAAGKPVRRLTGCEHLRAAGPGRAARARSPSSPPARGTSVVVGGGHNGLTAAAYLARAGHSVLVLERRSSSGGVHARDTVHRRAVRGEPVRVPRRPAAPARHRGARSRPHGYRDLPGRPGLWYTVRGRHVPHRVATTATARPPRCAALSAGGRRRLPRLRRAVRPDPRAARATARGATPGSATPPTGPSSRSCFGRRPRGDRRAVRRARSPTSSSATCATSGCAPRCTARA